MPGYKFLISRFRFDIVDQTVIFNWNNDKANRREVLTNSNTCACGDTMILRNRGSALWSMALLGHEQFFFFQIFFNSYVFYFTNFFIEKFKITNNITKKNKNKNAYFKKFHHSETLFSMAFPCVLIFWK